MNSFQRSRENVGIYMYTVPEVQQPGSVWAGEGGEGKFRREPVNWMTVFPQSPPVMWLLYACITIDAFVMPCKAKRLSLLTLKVSSYGLSASRGSTSACWPNTDHQGPANAMQRHAAKPNKMWGTGVRPFLWWFNWRRGIPLVNSLPQILSPKGYQIDRQKKGIALDWQ